MSLIFISHSSQDNAQAIALKDWLVENGWDDLFLDLDPHHGISAGERWQNALLNAAGQCDAVLFLISKNWLTPNDKGENWCMAEFRLAKQLNKQLFPLLLGNLTVEDIPAEISKEWQSIHLELGDTAQQSQKVTLPDGTTSSVNFSDSGLTALKNGLNKAGLNPSSFTWPPADDPERPPYRGLLPLEAEDAGIFFGRDGAIFSLMAELRGLRESAPPRFMVILGASGSGKSSFMRAGILPRLQREAQQFSVFPIIRPEQAVISGNNGFLQALNEQCKCYDLNYTRKALELAIASGEQAILPILTQISQAATLQLDEQSAKPPTLVFAIDQAEELFHSEGQAETEAFLKLLAQLSHSTDINVMVLSTIRSDAYEALQTAKSLDGIQQKTFSLPPIAKGAYQQIIEGPAKLLEKTKRPLIIEPQLTERLLKDLEEDASKDALPLLAFTLERLYIDYGDDGDLLLKEYLTFEKDIGGITQTLGLGGLSGAVEMAVEHALKQAQQDPKIPADRTACLQLLRRGLIPWLAGIDPQTKAPRRRVALYDEIPVEAQPLIDHLVEYRLLSKDSNKDHITTIEPAHESILRQWQQLHGWLKEDMADLSALETLKAATRDWEANNRGSGWLSHRGGRLQDAENLLQRQDFAEAINDSQRAYLSACRSAEDKQRDAELQKAQALAEAQQQALQRQQQVTKRTRLGLIVSFALLLVSSGTTFWAVKSEKKAQLKTEQAKLSTTEAIRQSKIARQNETMAKRQKKIAEDNRLEAEKQKTIAKQSEQRAKENLIKAREQTEKYQEQLNRSERLIKEISVSLQSLNNSDVQEALYEYTPLSVREPIIKVMDKLRLQLELESSSKIPALRQIAIAYTNKARFLSSQGKDEEALAFYEKSLGVSEEFKEDQLSDAEIQRDLSFIYNKLGETLYDIGENDKALIEIEKSLSLRKKLSEQSPSDNKKASDLAITYMYLGSLARDKNNLEKALDYNNKATEILENLSSKKPDNLKYKSELSFCYVLQGDIYNEKNQNSEANKSFNKALEIRKALVDKDGMNIQFQRNLAYIYYRIAQTQEKKENYSEAHTLYMESLSLREALIPLGEDYNDDLWLFGLHSTIGNLKYKEKKYKESAIWLNKALTIALDNTTKYTNKQVQLDLRYAYWSLGRLKIKLGHLDEALSYFLKSLDITQKLANKNPDDIRLQKKLSYAYNWLGAVEKKRHDYNQANKYYTKGLNIIQSIVDKQPNDQDAQSDLVSSYFDLGNVAKAKGKFDKEVEYYLLCLTIIKQLAEQKPSDVALQTDLRKIYHLLGKAEKNRQNYDKSLNYHRTALAIDEKLAKQESGNKIRQAKLAYSYSYVADALSDKKQYREAIRQKEQAEAILLTLDENTKILRNLVLLTNEMGNLYSDVGEYSSAKNYFEKALQIILKIDMINNASLTQRLLANTYEEIARVEKKLGNYNEALAAYQNSLNSLRELLKQDPKSMELLYFLVYVKRDIGWLYTNKDNYSQAKQYYKEAKETLEELIEKSPEEAKFQAELGHLYQEIGDLYRYQNHFDDATASYDLSLKIRKQLADDYPKNLNRQQALSEIYYAMGNLHGKRKKYKDALKAFKKGLDISNKLAASEPSHYRYSRDLANAYKKLGNLMGDMGHTKETPCVTGHNLLIVLILLQ